MCGSRSWADYGRVFAEVQRAAPTDIVHGAAKGADACADEAARELGIYRLRYAADWALDGKAAGPLRNARMLREGHPDRGLAFGPLWKPLGRGQTQVETAILGAGALRWKATGTGDMVRRMLDAGLPVRWVAASDATTVDLAKMPEPSR